MGCQIARALRHRHAQLLLGLGIAIRFHQRLAQQRVDAGLKVQQAERFGGGGDRGFEAPGLKMNAGQLRMHQWVLRIELKGGFQQLARLLAVAQLCERPGDTLAHAIA